MKKKFSAATSIAMVKISTELGKNKIIVAVSDSKLNWNVIELDEEDSKTFKEFMRRNDM